MCRFALLFILILCPLVMCKHHKSHRKAGSKSGGKDDLGGSLITSLRNDANIDLSVDEEYEDLRAELLAYHSALASITPSRRSMKTTPCWQLGGICINHKMCKGHRSLSEVAGCRDKLEVCCFTWNKYQVRDFKDQGIGNARMPWPEHQEFGGLGVVDPTQPPRKKKKKKLNTDYYDSEAETLNTQKHHCSDKEPQQSEIESEESEDSGCGNNCPNNVENELEIEKILNKHKPHVVVVMHKANKK